MMACAPLRALVTRPRGSEAPRGAPASDAPRRTRESTPPSGADGMVTVLYPAIVAVAGFVPWLESGTRTSLRPVSPRAR